jgi:hypothetical protein
MPNGGKNTRRTRGGNASLDKTKEKAIATDARTTLTHDPDVPFGSREEGDGSRDATERTMETPGAPKARRVQRRPETPNEDQREEEQLLEVQSTLGILWDAANEQRTSITEIARSYGLLQEANKSLSEANKVLWEELEKVKAELAGVVAMVKASRIPELALPKTQQEKRSVAVATTQLRPVVVHTQGPTSRERVVVVGLGEAAAALREEPLAAIKELQGVSPEGAK